MTSFPRSNSICRPLLCVLFACVLLLSVGCQALDIFGFSNQKTIRRAGQVELFYVDYDKARYKDKQTRDLNDRLSVYPSIYSQEAGHVGQLRPAMTWDPPRRNTLLGEDGESIRYPDDIVTIQVHGGFLYSLPWTLTGSTDIVLFAEVWENAAVGPGARSLNSIVYIGRAQMPEARMNFEGALAYGPTNFKGHPLKIKFTLMVLQRNRGEQMSNTTEVLQNLVSSSGGASVAGILSSEAIGIVRQILRSQPDVEAFDFEATLISDEPEMLQETLLGDGTKPFRPPSLRDVVRQLPDTRAEKMLPSDGENTGSDTENTDPSNIELMFVLYNLTSTIFMENFSPSEFSTAFQILQDLPAGQDWLGGVSIDKSRIDEAVSDIVKYLRELHPDDYDPSSHYDLLHDEDHLPSRVTFAILTIASLDREIIHTLNQSNLGDDDRESPSQTPAQLKPREREPGPQRLNWLRYGTFALIETKPRRLNHGSTYVDTSHFFWHEDYRVMGNSLTHKFADPTGSNYIRYAHANYIIFSIVPRQLEQHQSSLRAASAISDNLLRMLTAQGGDDPASLAESATKSFIGSVDRDALLHIGREAARKYSRDQVLQEMRRQHASYMAAFEDDLERYAGARRYAESIQHMWRWRVARHEGGETNNED